MLQSEVDSSWAARIMTDGDYLIEFQGLYGCFKIAKPLLEDAPKPRLSFFDPPTPSAAK
jgi:hypothetical protein